jgi:hypothetical protein
VAEQGALGREVVGEQAGRGAHLGGDGAQGQAAEAAGGQDAPDRHGDVAPAGVVIAWGGHAGSF